MSCAGSCPPTLYIKLLLIYLQRSWPFRSTTSWYPFEPTWTMLISLKLTNMNLSFRKLPLEQWAIDYRFTTACTVHGTRYFRLSVYDINANRSQLNFWIDLTKIKSHAFCDVTLNIRTNDVLNERGMLPRTNDNAGIYKICNTCHVNFGILIQFTFIPLMFSYIYWWSKPRWNSY